MNLKPQRKKSSFSILKVFILTFMIFNLNSDLVFASSIEHEPTQLLEELLKDKDINNLSVEDIFELYENGYKNEDFLIEYRKNLATEKGILGEVDEKYYFYTELSRLQQPSSYLMNHPDLVPLYDIDMSLKDLSYEKAMQMLKDAGVEVHEQSSHALMAPTPKIALGVNDITFTKGNNLSCYSDDGYFNQTETGTVEIKGSPKKLQAFCGNMDEIGFLYQMPFTRVVELPSSYYPDANLDLLKKIIYYGYGGDGCTSYFGWDETNFHIKTGLAVSNALNATSSESYQGNRFISKISNHAVPENFHVYVAMPVNTDMQPVVFGRIETPPDGQLKIKKSSTHPELTNENNAYSLVGATYGVYQSKDCLSTQKIADLIIDDSLSSNTLSLPQGTYWLKELTAPKGYQLDTTVYNVEVKSALTTEKELKDTPLTYEIDILLKKLDSESQLPLENAEFTLDFYKGEFEDGVNPETLGKTADETWVLKTDKEGYCRLNKDYLVLGEGLYPSLPFGTLVIHESKAPVGYKKSEEVWVKTLGLDTNGNLVAYQPLEISNQPITLTLVKKQAGVDVLLENITFKHTRPNGKSLDVVTDAKGQACLKNLEMGVHLVQEIKTLDGLLLDEKVYQFEVKKDGSIQALTKMNLTFEKNGNGILNIANQTAPFQIKVTKVNQFQQKLEGAEFGLYLDKTCHELVDTKTTNRQGELIFSGLGVAKKYYLKELKAPEGYSLPLEEDGSCHVYEIFVESVPSKNIFDFYVDGKKYTINHQAGEISLEGEPSSWVIHLTIENKTGVQLPHTGGQSLAICLVCGMMILCLGMVKFRKEKGRK